VAIGQGAQGGADGLGLVVAHQALLELGVVGHPVEVLGEELAHLHDSGMLALVAHGHLEMLEGHVDLLGPGDGRQLLAGFEEMPDFPEDPGPADGAAADHDGVHAVPVEELLGLAGVGYVAVADDGDRHARVGLDLADEGPVGLAEVALGAGASVDGQELGAGVLEHLGDADDVLAVVVVSQAGLGRYGQVGGAGDGLGHAGHFVGVVHHARAGAAQGDLLGGAAEVDVDEVGPGLGGHVGGLHHHADVVAVELDADGPLALEDAELGQASAGAVEQLVRGHELRVNHVGAVALAGVPEGDVGEALHGGQEERTFGEGDVADAHGRAVVWPRK